MGSFKLEVLLGSSAMQDARDVGEALGRVQVWLANGDTKGPIRDRNGNTVGSWYLDLSDQLSLGDSPLVARLTDPDQSHGSSEAMAKREGSTGTFTPGSHKHLILKAYSLADEPLTDTQAWRRAGLHHRSGAWHRCTDMKKAGAIMVVDYVLDTETGNEVRRCIITPYGWEVLRQLEAGLIVRAKKKTS